jgi:DNA-binding NtrC family response regulator
MAFGDRTDRSPRTILLIKDAPDVRQALTRALVPRRGDILAASNGAGALRIARRTRLDLVILDLKLPDISGTDLLRRLRSIDTDVPVIIITSAGSAETVRTAMELGAFDYLTKPFDAEGTTQIIQEALEWRSSMTVPL